MTITLQELRAAMPALPQRKAEVFLPYLNAAMVEFDINTKPRIAAFLAQLAHESGQLRWFEEFASGEAYDTGRLAIRLGNTPEKDGDGQKYKGRGPIQLTGRSNYEKAGKALGVDLVNHPERATWLEVTFRIAGWYWKTHGLNELADKGDFDAITRKINGGYNGKSERDKYHANIKKVLGV